MQLCNQSFEGNETKRNNCVYLYYKYKVLQGSRGWGVTVTSFGYMNNTTWECEMYTRVVH